MQTCTTLICEASMRHYVEIKSQDSGGVVHLLLLFFWMHPLFKRGGSNKGRGNNGGREGDDTARVPELRARAGGTTQRREKGPEKLPGV